MSLYSKSKLEIEHGIKSVVFSSLPGMPFGWKNTGILMYFGANYWCEKPFCL